MTSPMSPSSPLYVNVGEAGYSTLRPAGMLATLCSSTGRSAANQCYEDVSHNGAQLGAQSRLEARASDGTWVAECQTVPGIGWSHPSECAKRIPTNFDFARRASLVLQIIYNTDTDAFDRIQPYGSSAPSQERLVLRKNQSRTPGLKTALCWCES
jgi:hypothetical protein